MCYMTFIRRGKGDTKSCGAYDWRYLSCEGKNVDRHEYKIRAEEIKKLISEGNYLEAARVADTIDWSRVQKAGTLCTISDLYKKVRRYEDAIELLKLANERYPEGKDITYNLCELYIKLGDDVQAMFYRKEFQRIAPRDTRNYILKYKMYVLEEVNLEERIEVLREMRERGDIREKWMYELAYLYHRTGQITACVEECDSIFAWFGRGRYVYKAMELKMQHQPLTEAQQAVYESRFQDEDDLPPATAYDSTDQTKVFSHPLDENGLPIVSQDDEARALALGETRSFEPIRSGDMDIQLRPVDVSEYNTMNLQQAIAEGVAEVLDQPASSQEIHDSVTRSIISPLYEMDTDNLEEPELEEVSEDDIAPEGPERPGDVLTHSEVFFGETGEIDAEDGMIIGEAITEQEQPVMQEETVAQEPAEATAEASAEASAKVEVTVEEAVPAEPERRVEYREDNRVVYPKSYGTEEQRAKVEEARKAQPPEEIADVMTQESDGQIGLVLPESEAVDKQITGQMSITDVMADWERMKQENEERSRQALYQKVKRQTGEMFNEFEQAVLHGKLEEIEQAAAMGITADQAAARKSTPQQLEGFQEVTYEATPLVDTGSWSTEGIEELEEVAESGYAEDSNAGYGEELVEETYEAESYEEPAEESYEAESYEEPAEETYEAEVFEEALISPEEQYAPEEFAAEEPVAESPIAEETVSEAETTMAPEVSEEIEKSEEAAAEEEEEELAETDDPEESEEDAEDPEDAEEADTAEENAMGGVRDLTQEERELFAPYIQSKSAKKQLITLLEQVSMASYTGNILIPSDVGMDPTPLATRILKAVRMTDSNFTGKVAKTTGKKLNHSDINDTISKCRNGGLIVEGASEMNGEAADALLHALSVEGMGIVVVLTDRRREMERFQKLHPELCRLFTAKMELKALSEKRLAAFAKQYAYEKEYSIDEMGMLALHTKIEMSQTNEHAVNVVDVKEMVDEAIRHVRKKTPAHFFDVLLGKRYDSEDMIILGEKDFAS